MYCHDLEIMSSNPSWVKLGVRSTSVLSCALNIVYILSFLISDLAMCLHIVTFKGCGKKASSRDSVVIDPMTRDTKPFAKSRPMKQTQPWNTNTSDEEIHWPKSNTGVRCTKLKYGATEHNHIKLQSNHISYLKLDNALREYIPPWLRQIITPNESTTLVQS